MTTSRSAAAALMASIALAAVAHGAVAAPSGSPITIGAILSITGSYAPLGEPERSALQLAERDINAHGGIAGHPVRFKIVDDEGKADTAQQLATQLVGEKVAMIIGGTLSPTSTAIARVANDAKVAQIFMTPTRQIWDTPRGVQRYTFEATPRNELEAEKIAAFIKDRLGKKRLAVLHDEAQYGTTGSGVFEAEAKKQGLEIADDEAFAINATDLTPQLQKARASGADTIVIWTASPAAALLVKQARQFGIRAEIVGSTGIVSANFLRVAGRDGFGVYADQDIDLTYPSPGQRAFIAQYRAANNGAEPVNFASFAWDAAHLAALALTATKGNTSGDAIVAALEGMKPYRGTTGEYKFTATDHNGMRAADVRMVRDNPVQGDQGSWKTLPPAQQ